MDNTNIWSDAEGSNEDEDDLEEGVEEENESVLENNDLGDEENEDDRMENMSEDIGQENASQNT